MDEAEQEESNGYQRLDGLIEPFIDKKSFEDLPPDIQKIVRARSLSIANTWNGLDSDGRRKVATAYDQWHDPENLAGRRYGFGLFWETDRVRKVIDDWKGKDDHVPSEAVIKDSKLVALRGRLAALEKLWNGPDQPIEDWEALTDDALAKVVADAPAPEQTPATPAPVEAVGALDDVVTNSDVPVLTTAPAWSLIAPPERLPGYRWPLYQFLEAAHTAGKPCPKAQHVLDAWKLTPPPGIKVIQKDENDALEYELDHGGKKTADLKAIQASIVGLID